MRNYANRSKVPRDRFGMSVGHRWRDCLKSEIHEHSLVTSLIIGYGCLQASAQQSLNRTGNVTVPKLVSLIRTES